jgi:proline iminopeptidase
MSTSRTPDLFPPIEPYRHGFLPTEAGHAVYFEECGSPAGLPVVFLHGGPGSGCGPKHRQLFPPADTRVVLFDQRGCGRSTAVDALQGNTTAHLLHDMERLRLHLGIERWLVVGGSWGGGLGLAYASAHPAVCLGAIIRGVFLSRESDLQWFFHDARQCMPDAWASLAAVCKAANPEKLLEYVCQRFLKDSEEEVLPLALAWQAWENALTQRSVSTAAKPAPGSSEAKSLIAKYRLQSHYLINQCFFPRDGLLSHLSAMHDMPVTLVHGRLDWICRPESAWEVHQALPQSQLMMVDHAGHNPFEQPMTGVLVKAIEDMVLQLSNQG